MYRYIIGLFLALSLGCSTKQTKTFELSELTIPNPEAEWLHEKGILEVYAVRDSSEDADNSKGKYHDIFSYQSYDSLGHLLWNVSSIAHGGSMEFTYRPDGWVDMITSHTCFLQKTKQGYLYFKAWRKMLCFGYSSSPGYVWLTYNHNGKLSKLEHRHFNIFYEYDSLERLVSETKIFKKSKYFHGSLGAIRKEYTYASNVTTPMLTSIAEMHITESLKIEKGAGYIKRYDCKGLPLDQVFDDDIRWCFSFAAPTKIE